MERETTTENKAELPSVQSWINRKVVSDLSVFGFLCTTTFLNLFNLSYSQKKNRLLCRKLWTNSSGSSKGTVLIIYWCEVAWDCCVLTNPTSWICLPSLSYCFPSAVNKYYMCVPSVGKTPVHSSRFQWQTSLLPATLQSSSVLWTSVLWRTK